MLETGWLAAASAAFVGLSCGLWWAHSHAQWRVGRRMAHTRKTGRRGQACARRMLRRAGYKILEEEVRGTMDVLVDGERRTFAIRADLLACRARRHYIAEVKAGAASDDVTNRFTRRQLLEYLHAFNVDGVLLVRPNQKTIHRIELPRN